MLDYWTCRLKNAWKLVRSGRMAVFTGKSCKDMSGGEDALGGNQTLGRPHGTSLEQKI